MAPSRRIAVGVAVAVAVASAVVIGGCAEGGLATGSGVEPLAKAEGWRAEADPGTADVPFGLVEVADDADTAQRAWDENVPDDLGEADAAAGEPGVYGSLDDVDPSRQALVVWHSGESSACPSWLADINTDGAVTIERDEHVPGDGCTDDYNPYRMVLAVDRDRLPDTEQLPTGDVDVDGITDGRVSAYPDRAFDDSPVDP